MGTWFKKLPDGRWAFYAWGRLSRGYIISSEQEVRRLFIQLWLWLLISLFSTIGVYWWRGVLAACVPFAFWGAIYFVWIGFRSLKWERYQGGYMD